MSVFWLIESPRHNSLCLLEFLQGNYAVRAFGSWSSFVRLNSAQSQLPPAGLIVNTIGLDSSIDEIDEYLVRKFPRCLRIFLVQPHESFLLQKEGRFVFGAEIDLFKLKHQLETIIEINAHISKNRQSFKDLCLDSDELCVEVAGGECHQLTQKEYLLLNVLMKNADKCIERNQFIDDVWQGVKVSPRTIDSHVSRLRKRLRTSEVVIESVYGGGYVLR